MKLIDPSIKIIDTNSIIKNIERGGRICYKSEDKMGKGTDIEFCRKIRNYKHFSVYEHGIVTVQIICDRGVSHELVRHRLAAYSQESTRYCNYNKGKFGQEITVIDTRGAFPYMSEQEFECWCIAMSNTEQQYLRMISAGSSAQLARSVLPNSLKTEIQMTANIREWIHVFNVRAHRDAHPQMRQIMIPLATAFKEKWPVLFEDIEVDLETTMRLASVTWEI